MEMSTLEQIEQVIFRYSLAMDRRAWKDMDDVFVPDARIVMEDMVFPSRETGVAAIQGFIERCSQTHHVNSNILIRSVEGNDVRTVTNFRAWHRGRDARADEILECLGTYEDVFRHTPQGWRIVERIESSPIVIGSIETFFSDVAPVPAGEA